MLFLKQLRDCSQRNGVGMEQSQETTLLRDHSPQDFAGSIPRPPSPGGAQHLQRYSEGRAMERADTRGCARAPGDNPELQITVPRAPKKSPVRPLPAFLPGAPCSVSCSCWGSISHSGDAHFPREGVTGGKPIFLPLALPAGTLRQSCRRLSRCREPLQMGLGKGISPRSRSCQAHFGQSWADPALHPLHPKTRAARAVTLRHLRCTRSYVLSRRLGSAGSCL